MPRLTKLTASSSKKISSSTVIFRVLKENFPKYMSKQQTTQNHIFRINLTNLRAIGNTRWYIIVEASWSPNCCDMYMKGG